MVWKETRVILSQTIDLQFEYGRIAGALGRCWHISQSSVPFAEEFSHPGKKLAPKEAVLAACSANTVVNLPLDHLCAGYVESVPMWE